MTHLAPLAKLWIRHQRNHLMKVALFSWIKQCHLHYMISLMPYPKLGKRCEMCQLPGGLDVEPHEVPVVVPPTLHRAGVNNWDSQSPKSFFLVALTRFSSFSETPSRPAVCRSLHIYKNSTIRQLLRLTCSNLVHYYCYYTLG